MLGSSATAQIKSAGAAEPTGTIAEHELVLCRDGSVKGWGYNYSGQVNSAFTYVYSPVTIAIPGATDIVYVTATLGCSFAIRTSGQLLAWGDNRYGKLGIGAGIVQTPTPTVVPLPSPVVSVTGGANYTMALCADGTVWTWGSNSGGCLGDNSPYTLTRYVPAQIPPARLANIRVLVSGGQFCLALNNDGRMFSWGMDGNGSLGIGVAPNSNAVQPVPVMLGLTNVRQIDASNMRGGALRADGTVWGWGINTIGELGTGNTNYTSSPAQVGTGIITDARWLSLNDNGGLATRADGSTYVWGSNNFGGLGQTTPAQAISPIPGPSFSPGVQIIGHGWGFMSLETSGVVKKWGIDALGYVPAAPGPIGQSYVPTTPTGLCPAVPTASFPACGQLRAYYQQGTANYRAVLHNCWESPAEIGTFGQLTTIDVSQSPYNGTLTFDGYYRVRGNVRFINGNVTLAPGTVFYIESNNGGVYTQYDDSRLVSIVFENGTLTLNGATMQASCPTAPWLGIYMTGPNCRLVTNAGPTGTTPSVLRDAQECVVNGGGTLRLDQTYFFNNLVSVLEYPHVAQATPAEGITGCRFEVNPNLGGPLAAGAFNRFASVGIKFDWNTNPAVPNDFSAATYSTNRFIQLGVGIVGIPGNGLLQNNTFTSCWLAAWADGNYANVSTNNTTVPTRFEYNTVLLPSSYPAAFTTAPNRPVYGITALQCIRAKHNTFGPGTAIPGQAASRRIGIALPYGGTVEDNNTFDGLQVGIQANGADQYMPIAHTFSGNDFYGLAEGITFQPPGPYTATNLGINVTMRCNTFATTASTATGVWVKANTVFPSALGTAGLPNGNRFDYIADATKRFVYDATSIMQYNRYSSTQEAFAGAGNTIYGIAGSSGPVAPVVVRPSSTAVATNACGAYAPIGVNARPASPLLPAALLQLRQDSLARHSLPAARQTKLLADVLDHHRYAQSFAALETYLRPLSSARPAVYIPGALLLLNAYRQTGHEADAQRVRPTLNTLATTDGELLNYLRYWDAVGHLRPDRRLPFSYDLPAADLAALRLSAASGTLAARPACELLQRLDTNCRCVLPDDLAPAAQALAARRTGTNNPASLGEAHPNPATETVSLAYTLPADAGTATLVLSDVFGRVVTSRLLEQSSGLASLPVQALPAGLYLATLRANGHLLATRKLSVTR